MNYLVLLPPPYYILMLHWKLTPSLNIIKRKRYALPWDLTIPVFDSPLLPIREREYMVLAPNQENNKKKKNNAIARIDE